MAQKPFDAPLWDSAGWTLDPYDCWAVIKMAIAAQNGMHDAELSQVTLPLAMATDPDFARAAMDKIESLSQTMGWENLVALAVGTATLLMDRSRRVELLHESVVSAVGNGVLHTHELGFVAHLAEGWGIPMDELCGSKAGEARRSSG